ncbi:MAG: hypothetical protein WBW33_14585, partial [Bryobacteraceae bacterium]
YIGVSAAALFLFGAQSIQAQEAAKADIPFSFHSKLVAYESGTYTLKAPYGNSAPLVLVNEDTRKASFVPTVSSIEPTAKTEARGPVMIFKCGQGTCFLSEVWTTYKGYSISHPQVLDEEASTTRIVALVRAAR